MERRKVQKVGYSTLSISLPKNWVLQTNVNQGDYLYLFSDGDGSLTILTERQIKEESRSKDVSINLDLIKDSGLLRRLIFRSYMIGAETITISSKTRIENFKKKEIRDILNETVGLSTLEETEKKMLLTCSIDLSRFHIHSLIRRLATIALTMFDESVKALRKLDVDLANDVIKREYEANATHLLTMRLLFSARTSSLLAERTGLNVDTDIPDCWSYSRELERVADCSKSIAMIVIDLCLSHEKVCEKKIKELLRLSQLASDILSKAVNSLFTGDVTVANEAFNTLRTINSETKSFLQKNDPALYVRTVTLMLQTIVGCSARIATITIHSRQIAGTKK